MRSRTRGYADSLCLAFLAGCLAWWWVSATDPAPVYVQREAVLSAAAVANSGSEVYHEPDCPSVGAGPLRLYDSPAEAAADGLRLCRHCYRRRASRMEQP